MIKINEQEYEDCGGSRETAGVLLKINGMTDVQVEYFLQHEDFKKTSVEEIQAFMKELDIRVANKVLLSSISYLTGQPNDVVVFLSDLHEKFLRTPNLSKVVRLLYPEGFYTTESLKERVKWLKENRGKLKEPRLLDYLVIENEQTI